jgi:hypothetical protein
MDGGSPRAVRSLKASLRALLLLVTGTAGLAADAASTAPAVDDEISPWDWSATLRAGVGYKDNVLLSDFFKESSVFTFTEAEAFLFRVPTDGWEFTGVLTGEDRRFWQSESVDKEQLLLTSAEVKRAFAEKWKAGFGLQYFYNDQVFDASVAEGLPFRVRAKLHRFSGGPSIQYNLSETRRIEANFAVVRQEFGAPLDDSWEFGPKILFAQKYGEIGSEVTASVQWRHRTYDDRAAPGFDDKSLTFEIPEFELGVKHYWDDEKVWRSRAKAGLEINGDNGNGFFDYRRWKLSHELDFTQGGFEGILQAKLLYYEYQHQVVENQGGRRRTELVFGARARKEIVKHVGLFVEAEHEWVMATDFEERYHATTVWGGIEWEVK